MNPMRPYLLRAFYEWITDNDGTPHIEVDAEMPHVKVPEKYIQNGRIILNIAPKAIRNLNISNEAVDFEATFSGITEYLYIPIAAVVKVYMAENLRGTIFEPEIFPDPEAATKSSAGQETGKFNVISHATVIKTPQPWAKKPELHVIDTKKE